MPVMRLLEIADDTCQGTLVFSTPRQDKRLTYRSLCIQMRCQLLSTFTLGSQSRRINPAPRHPVYAFSEGYGYKNVSFNDHVLQGLKLSLG